MGRQRAASAAQKGRAPPTSAAGDGAGIWSQIPDGEILLIINLQGIQVVNNSRRDKIVLHIDFEDILYVMGKGSRLKIGFVVHSQVFDLRSTQDCKTEFATSNLAGHKARSVAEDIMAYVQLKLVEMTKNGNAEFLSRNYATQFLDKLDHKNNEQSSLLASHSGFLHSDHEEESKPDATVHKPRTNSFKGLQDMVLAPRDMLDSFDLEDNSELMNEIGQTKIAEKLKDLTSAERYSKQIQAQLGNHVKFKASHFLMYTRRYPLWTAAQKDLNKSVMSKLSSSLSRSMRNHSNTDGGSHAHDSNGSSVKPSGSVGPSKPRVAGSFSGGTAKFSLRPNDHSVIEEQKSEDSSMD